MVERARHLQGCLIDAVVLSRPWPNPDFFSSELTAAAQKMLTWIQEEPTIVGEKVAQLKFDLDCPKCRYLFCFTS